MRHSSSLLGIQKQLDPLLESPLVYSSSQFCLRPLNGYEKACIQLNGNKRTGKTMKNSPILC